MVGEQEGFLCPPGWVYSELSGTANVVGLRLSYLVVLEGSRKCFKDAIDASKDLDLKAGEADAETIHSKLEEFMAALTPWSAPADAASPAQALPGDLAEATGGQAVADAAEGEATGGNADAGAAEVPQLFPKEVEPSLDQPSVGERWIVFKSVDIMNCVVVGCRVFVREDKIFLQDNTILEADVCEISEVHNDDSTLKMKYVFKEGEIDGVALRLCYGKV